MKTYIDAIKHLAGPDDTPLIQLITQGNFEVKTGDVTIVFQGESLPDGLTNLKASTKDGLKSVELIAQNAQGNLRWKLWNDVKEPFIELYASMGPKHGKKAAEEVWLTLVRYGFVAKDGA